MEEIVIKLPKIEKKKGKRKVLRIATQEFLYQIFPDRITTTGHVKNALDLRDIDVALLNNILNSLVEAGYKDIKVIEVK